MNYLVTGATGFIGRRLVSHLLNSGHTVNYLARKRSSTMDGRAAFFCWEPATKPPIDCMGRLDAVVHLAGETVAQRWTPESKQRIVESRIGLTHSLVEAMRNLKRKPEVLVSASAIGIYGHRGDEVLTEESAPSSGFLSDLCVAWEREAERAREFGLRVVPVRIAVVLGAEGGALKPMLPLFRAGLGGPLSSGKQWMSWIEVNDLVRLLEFAARNRNVQHVLNGSAPEPVRNKDFTAALAAVLHRPAILPAPRFALRLALGAVADHILDSARVLPEGPLRQGFQFKYADIKSALGASVGSST